MTDLTEHERETLHHIVNADKSKEWPQAHLDRLLTLGLIRSVDGDWKATESGRLAGVPRPEHL